MAPLPTTQQSSPPDLHRVVSSSRDNSLCVANGRLRSPLHQGPRVDSRSPAHGIAPTLREGEGEGLGGDGVEEGWGGQGKEGRDSYLRNIYFEVQCTFKINGKTNILHYCQVSTPNQRWLSSRFTSLHKLNGTDNTAAKATAKQRSRQGA